MPLSMMKAGEPGTIKRIGGRGDTRRFLENLGFVAGSMVTVKIWRIKFLCERIKI